MRRAYIFYDNTLAGIFTEKDNQHGYIFEYLSDYQGNPISLTIPTSQKIYVFEKFPSFFDGVLPEGPQLEALLRYAKIDRKDYFSQLMVVGEDLVGAVTVKEILDED